jgi:apolipoprotein N-acyltransferase
MPPRPAEASATTPWPRLGRLAGSLQRLAGWRRWLAAFLLGAAGALALPPFYLVPLLIPMLAALVWWIDAAPRRRSAFAAGWWIGFGHFSAGFYWIANALLVDPLRFGWMIPPVVGGLAAGMALFIGLAALLTHAVPMRGPARVLILALAWVLCEWVRGWFLTGFPWNLLGYVWMFSDALIQPAAYVGVWGLSLLSVVALAMPAILGLPGPARRGWIVTIAALLLPGLVWLGGLARLAEASDATSGLRLRIVQPAIEQTLKNDPNARVRNLELLAELTRRPGDGPPPPLVIWPEAAVPFLIERDPPLRRSLGALLPPGGHLITGAPRAEPAEGDLAEIWNSLSALDGSGAILATFDKFHLVPLGEYVPLREVFPFLSKVTPGAMDFSAGPGPRTLRVSGLPPFGPLICYEVIFPHAIVDEADRPDWLVNLTNDGWFGASTGPYQHFASARMRAVEEGLPLVRAANSGISGVIDPYGRVIASLALGERGILDAKLPLPIPQTLFARFGGWNCLALGLLILGIALALDPRNWSGRSGSALGQ